MAKDQAQRVSISGMETQLSDRGEMMFRLSPAATDAWRKVFSELYREEPIREGWTAFATSIYIFLECDPALFDQGDLDHLQRLVNRTNEAHRADLRKASATEKQLRRLAEKLVFGGADE